MAFLLLPGTPIQTKAVASISDAGEYQTLARNLAQHHAFSRSAQPPRHPEVLRTPGYPLFLAPFYALFHDPLVPILVAQLLLSLLLVFAVYRFCLELGLDRRVSGLAALLAAISPNIAFVSTKLVTETLFTLLLLITLLLFLRLRSLARARDAAACGACCGLLMLIRPIAVFFPFLLALLVITRSFSRKSLVHTLESAFAARRLLSAAILLACAALVVLPWFARNAKLSGRWMLSTAGEHNLFLYNAATVVAAEQGVDLAVARDIMRAEAAARSGPVDTLNEARLWRTLTPIAWQHVLKQPWIASKVQVIGFFSTLFSPISLRPLAVHSGASQEQVPNVAQAALALFLHSRVGAGFKLLWQARVKQLGAFAAAAFVLALCFNLGLLVLGVAFFVSRSSFIVHRSSLSWLLWPVLYFSLLTGALGDARMRVPIEPLLCIFAAAGLAGRVQSAHPESKTRNPRFTAGPVQPR